MPNFEQPMQDMPKQPHDGCLAGPAPPLVQRRAAAAALLFGPAPASSSPSLRHQGIRGTSCVPLCRPMPKEVNAALMSIMQSAGNAVSETE